MKKIIVLILTAFTFWGCSDTLQFNTPAFQTKKDGNLWKAVTYNANIDGAGVLTIVASDNLETIILVVNNTVLGVHDVVQTTSSGTLLDIDNVLFSSNNTPNPNIQIYPAGGQINLTDVNTEEAYVSGTFYFNAFTNSGLTAANFNEGNFYKIPLVGAAAATVETCTTITATVAVALTAFNLLMIGDSGYEAACNAYKTALETQITLCGDTGGTTQAIIDALTCV